MTEGVPSIWETAETQLSTFCSELRRSLVLAEPVSIPAGWGQLLYSGDVEWCVDDCMKHGEPSVSGILLENLCPETSGEEA